MQLSQLQLPKAPQYRLTTTITEKQLHDLPRVSSVPMNKFFERERQQRARPLVTMDNNETESTEKMFRHIKFSKNNAHLFAYKLTDTTKTVQFFGWVSEDSATRQKQLLTSKVHESGEKSSIQIKFKVRHKLGCSM